VNVIHFFFWCFCIINVYWVLVISLFLRLWIIYDGKLLFLGIVSMVFHSCCLACSVIGSVIILFIQKMKAANFCLNGWLDVKCIVMSVYVGLLWISVLNLLLCL